MKLAETQKEKLEKTITNARNVGFGLFSLDPFYNKDAEKTVVLEIYHKDNFFEHKPNTYLVKIGGSIGDLKVVGEYGYVNMDLILGIIEKY